MLCRLGVESAVAEMEFGFPAPGGSPRLIPPAWVAVGGFSPVRISRRRFDGSSRTAVPLASTGCGVTIPRPSGGERLLGVPTALDRLIQQTLLQVLRPLFDPHFGEYSFGFGRGAR